MSTKSSNLIKGSSKIVDLSRPMIVTLESFQTLKDAKVASESGDMFESTLIIADTISRNSTYYGQDDLDKSMRLPKVQEKIDNRVFFGEAEHPAQDDPTSPMTLRRLLRVEPTRIVQNIMNWWWEGNEMKSLIRWCGPMGSDYKGYMVDCGSNLAQSIRAYTPVFVERTGGPTGKYVQKKHEMAITSFDCVTLPGLFGTRNMKDADFKAATGGHSNLRLKSMENFSEYTFNNPVDEFRTLARSQEGLECLNDMFGINFERDSIVINNGKAHIALNSMETLQIPLNRAMLSSIL